MKRFGQFTSRRLLGNTQSDQISDLRDQLADTRRRSKLSELAGTLPDLIGMRFISSSDNENNEPTDADFTGWVMAAVAQALADGNFTLAYILAGAVRYGVGDAGEFIRGVDYLSNHIATYGAYDRRARRGFQVVDSLLAYLVEMIDDATPTNLITTNPSFETGSLATGFVSSTNWSVFSTYAYTGTYSAWILNTNTNSLETNKYAVTAGNTYRCAAWTYKGTGTITIEVKWYNSVPTLLQTDTVFQGSIAQYSWEEHAANIAAPSGATQAALVVRISSVSGSAALVIDDLSLSLVSEYAAVRLGDEGVDLVDEAGYLRYSGGSVAMPEITSLVAPASGRGSLGFESADRKLHTADVSSYEHVLGGVSWQPFSWPIGYSVGTALTTSQTLAANGGACAIPIWLSAPMLLESLTLRNNDLNLLRTFCWYLYRQDTNTGTSSENTLTRVASGTATSFTPAAAASNQTSADAAAPTMLSAGLYWAVIQNQHATNAFSLGSQAQDILALNVAQTKTITNPAGSTLDFVAATWTKITSVPGVRLNGRVFGETTNF